MKFRRFDFSILFILAFIVTIAQAQDKLDDFATKIRVGSNEEKREALFQIRNLKSEAASRIAIPALKDKNEIVRATAARSILSLPGDEAAQALLPLISDKKQFVREEVAYALGETKSLLALAPLIERLRRERNDEVRGAIAFALGRLGDIRAEEILIAVLANNKNLFVQRSAARALGEIRSNKSVSVLIATLRDPLVEDDVKREAAYALGLIGDEAARQILEENLNAKDYLLAQICKDALAKINP